MKIDYESFGYGKLEFENDPRLDGYDPTRVLDQMATRKEINQQLTWIAKHNRPFHQRLPLSSQLYLRETAARTIGSALGLKGDELEKFARCAADKNEDKAIVQRIADVFKNAQEDPTYSTAMMATAIVDAISDVQDAYRRGLIEQIENGRRNEVLSNIGFDKLTPIELSGVSLAKDHFLDYVQPILQQIGDHTEWRDEYYRRSEELLRNCDINNPNAEYNGLQEYLIENNIAGCGMHSLENNIMFVYSRAMPDLLTDGFSSDDWFRRKLESQGIDFNVDEKEFIRNDRDR